MTDPRSLSDLLAEAEALLRTRTRARMGRDVDGREGGTQTAQDLAGLLAELDAAAADRPDDATRHARRLDRVRALAALQMREVPGSTLEGLYEDIRAEVTGANAWHRAGMSGAFLDAPRSLVLWRRAALAACLLLAVGAGFSLGGGTLGSPGVDYGGQTMLLVDPRDALLERLDARGPAAPPAAQPAGYPGAARGGMRTVGSAPRRGLYVFGRGARRASAAEADARRMLDGIQIFPIPGRAVEEGEQN